MIVKAFLIVRANGEIRTSKRAQRIATDEIAVPIEITVPNEWGSVDRSQAISIKLPGPARIEQVGKPVRGAREP